MARATKLTLTQKKMVRAAGFNEKDFLLVKETEEELTLAYKGTGKIIKIYKCLHDSTEDKRKSKRRK